MTMLKPGEMLIRKDGKTFAAVSGGFLEVEPDHITILADAAERADEIDIARAEAAKRRAEDNLTGKTATDGSANVQPHYAAAGSRLLRKDETRDEKLGGQQPQPMK